MSKEVAILDDRDQCFIDNLLNNGGNIRQASIDAGFSNGDYGYKVRRRLSKEIAEATQQWISFHGPKAAQKVIDTMDAEMPNPIQLAAAKDILDRAGVKLKEEVQEVHVKANIFILPEKRVIEEAKIIDIEPE